MLVKNWMSKNAITVDRNDSMQDAMKYLKEHDIRIYDIDRPSLSRLKEVLREKVKMLYIINQREKMSEIF